MNKLFIKPEIDIYKFTVNDIVYTSGSELTSDEQDTNSGTGYSGDWSWE